MQSAITASVNSVNSVRQEYQEPPTHMLIYLNEQTFLDPQKKTYELASQALYFTTLLLYYFTT